jgi:glycosyltransferase involved in cell wall biosynthesis
MSIKFSVIIPTHQRPDDLKNCILSVLRQDFSAECFELIVVDNDKKGSAEDVVKDLNSNKYKIRYEKRNSNNVSESRNLGAKLAEGLWLAFLDDDCITDSNWLFHAEQLTLAYQSRGLIIGGGYKKDGSDSFGDIAKAEILPNNLYLVEGNCFYLKKEYLEIGGMRSDLGPSDKRFGYHEGSELQDRYKKHYGHNSLRILDKKIAVTHLARKKPKKWLSVVSGYDSIAAFEKKKKISYSGNIIRGIGCLLRFSLYLIRSKNDLCLRELYRLGEIFGEISLRTQTQYRNLTSLLRHFNNRIIGERTNNNPSLKTACLNDLVLMLQKIQTFFLDTYLFLIWPKLKGLLFYPDLVLYSSPPIEQILALSLVGWSCRNNA